MHNLYVLLWRYLYEEERYLTFSLRVTQFGHVTKNHVILADYGCRLPYEGEFWKGFLSSSVPFFSPPPLPLYHVPRHYLYDIITLQSVGSELLTVVCVLYELDLFDLVITISYPFGIHLLMCSTLWPSPQAAHCRSFIFPFVLIISDIV